MKIGILGGGQLGRMLFEAIIPEGNEIHFLENDVNCPCKVAGNLLKIGSITDYNDVFNFGKDKDVVSYEIENVNIEALMDLQKNGVLVLPNPSVLKLIKDKGTQKNFYFENKFPTATYCLPKTKLDFDEFIINAPSEHIVIKQRTGGYDGKGVKIIEKTEASEHWELNLLLEHFIAETVEYSVIVAVNRNEIACYDPIEMYFGKDSNLVEFLFSPTNLQQELANKCKQIAMDVVKKFNTDGIFAVELFITNNGEILINEIAPRPHNSGHHTIEAAYTSQFEQFARILKRKPLGSTNLIMPSAMVNLVGAENQFGTYNLKFEDELNKMEGVYIHLYGKKEIKPNRKMGHITVLATDLEMLMEKANKVKSLAVFETK